MICNNKIDPNQPTNVNSPNTVSPHNQQTNQNYKADKFIGYIR